MEAQDQPTAKGKKTASKPQRSFAQSHARKAKRAKVPVATLRRNAEQLRTKLKQAEFLAEFSRTGVVGTSAAAVGIGRRIVYNWLADDEDYRKLHDEAIEDAADRLESEARRRAEQGVDEPVFHQGKECGSIRKYSDALMITLLKGRRPEVFKDRVQSDVTMDGTMRHGRLIDPSTSTTEELLARLAKAQAVLGALGAYGPPETLALPVAVTGAVVEPEP